MAGQGGGHTNSQCPNILFAGNETMNNDIVEFLKESNAIERVYDDGSLVQAKQAWDYLVRHEELTEKVILETHKILMKNQAIDEKDKGNWRTCQVWVGGREGIPYCNIPYSIEGWLHLVSKTRAASKKDEWIKQCHVQYETIHPFIDGNGRTGRMFLNWQRLRVGLPILIVHEGKEQQEYYKWFI